MDILELKIADLLEFFHNHCKGCPFYNTICKYRDDTEGECDPMDMERFDGICYDMMKNNKIQRKLRAAYVKRYEFNKPMTVKQARAIKFCEIYCPKYEGHNAADATEYLNKNMENAQKAMNKEIDKWCTRPPSEESK
jgi:hypothetical protein